MVFPDSLEGTINTIASDPKAGGASSGLVVHNSSETFVTKLASTIYWCELYLTRSLPGSMAVSDCQSGPSAAFRLSAIRPILVPWYNQTVFGKRMVSSYAWRESCFKRVGTDDAGLQLAGSQRRSTSDNSTFASRVGGRLCGRHHDRNRDSDNSCALDPSTGKLWPEQICIQ